ncbi:MAG: hypothetical protein KDC12_01510 [Flavobacteriales bacterium]|nr:hypothetical protein [Flavobacteriales bacterium]
MSQSLTSYNRTMGTLPVFMTAISTILGAILFLRFGYSVAHVGLLLTLAIILLGHAVTVPTAMAVAEIATNQRVEGGGAYYIISRSFGLNIGGAIGIALYLSQAISVAFYIIAFTTSTEILRAWIYDQYHWVITDAMVNYGLMALLTVLMLTKGANVGVKALYVVVTILFGSLVAFFLGKPTAGAPSSIDWFATIPEGTFDYFVERKGESVAINKESFFTVFTIIFPAFTGIAAGLGLSGDLKEPKKSIPQGTLWATIVGIVVYVAVAFKLYFSASAEDLAGDEMWMQQIALWAPAIPIGLACAAVSSALGSIMIAPRTLQAIGADQVLPGRLSALMAKARTKDGEPINASIVSCAIGFLIVSIGELNLVAELISMFFMVTYGAICMVSFFEHMAADPAYRPTFRSRWYVSLGGGVLCLILMFQMNFTFAVAAIVMMVLIYIGISAKNKGRRGIENLFKGIIFQVTRRLQIFIQKRDELSESKGNWRPFVISMSANSFERRSSFDMVRWMAHTYGFGTYVHYIEGFLNAETRQKARRAKARLIELAEGLNSRVYMDTMISPSFTSAIAQSVQLPGISGKGNNLIVFEYTEHDQEALHQVIDNFSILKTAELDICLLRSSQRGYGYHRDIHIWITTADFENSNLMILLGYIILGHPEWEEGDISIYSICNGQNREAHEARLAALIKEGRLAISPNNVQLIEQEPGEDVFAIMNQYSIDSDLTIIGFEDDWIDNKEYNAFLRFKGMGNALFVNASNQLHIT